MKNLILFMAAALLVFTSCNKDSDTTDPVAQTRNIDVEVGGPDEPNQVFVDLSTGNQTIVDKTSWNLAFESGIARKVHLNSSTGTLAAKFETTDLSSITSADVTELTQRFSLDIIFGTLVSGEPEPWLAESGAWVDSPDGGKTRTAIDEINSSPDANFVYVINPGTSSEINPQEWYKVRVTYGVSAKYELQYAKLDDPVIKTVEINPDNDYNFAFFSLENNEFVNVEPPKDEWDIAFTTWTEIENFGFEIPYLFKDYVIQNREGVFSAEYIIDSTANLVDVYDNFTFADAAGVTLSADVNFISNKWRSVASPSPGSVTAVRSDRFYIIRDKSGKYYKLAFTKMLNGTGERGYPAIQFTELN